MNLEYSELEDGIRLIKLTSMLDMDGTTSIGAEFARYCEGENVFVLVDLERLTYLSSIGIPLLISNAKVVVARGGRLALVKPQPNVKYVLDITGVSHILRIYNDIETAQARVKSA